MFSPLRDVSAMGSPNISSNITPLPLQTSNLSRLSTESILSPLRETSFNLNMVSVSLLFQKEKKTIKCLLEKWTFLQYFFVNCLATFFYIFCNCFLTFFRTISTISTFFNITFFQRFLTIGESCSEFIESLQKVFNATSVIQHQRRKISYVITTS